ncbi:uncharacterized protein Z518_06240 [Rhinocladiella mackenziei CBS 650.93]|uniref:Rhinocladiella mackenziei CBS 650.93 unplaced genomic scaffold supercont1.4, whole genome shotgun sequence n=1 Tax=Rhinocladiella mackenziei CBS 650.93 TaxID=1442369 RepID=A0A0D2H4N0_9EURO|nr:uncharacterized protein Z518_06240 [Rhinocladiella mackenziei CBS 650.93]KIX05368.1 hypothetical protein Z518_06240 [Rhinocladiella mackenziei CBS 650.93]
MAPKTPSYARQTRSSNLKSRTLSNTTGQPENSAADEPSNTFSTPLSTKASGRSQSVKTATVRDTDFEETQLIPRGVEIHREQDLRLGIVTGAHAYFDSGTPPEPAQSREFYLSIIQTALAGRAERDIDNSIFLPTDANFIKSLHRAYHRMGVAHVSESEFKVFAWQNLFIGQHVVLMDDTERQLCAVRLVEISLKPRDSDQQRMWRAPPLLSSNQPPPQPFVFDISSNSQFWLSDKIINANYRRYTKSAVHCKPWGTFCPYLSIEFEATTDDRRVVRNQMAAAGLISLFNRYQLKLDAALQPTPEQLRLVRHYGLTMEKAVWTVWVFEPKIADGAWAGCTIRLLESGTCLDEGDIVGLLQWINEIHRWGLCEYALGCEEDIKQILSRGAANLRISTIGS